MIIKHYMRALRPKSWLKNIFVFVPIVFSMKLFDMSSFTAAFVAFTAFCLVSSAVYIFNDLLDIEKDRVHPVKCNRPIAAGKIGVKSAVFMAVLLSIVGLAAIYYVAPLACAFVALYIIENIAYTLILKHRPIYDVFCIAAGFVLRVFVGGACVGEGISDWLFLTVVAMSLFMAFGKRRGEMLRVDGKDRRAVLKGYDIIFLNGMLFSTAGLAIIFYSLWAMDRGLRMIYTVPIIIFIVCKYLLLLQNTDSHGDPTTVILTNRTLLLACVIYGFISVGLLYSEG